MNSMKQTDKYHSYLRKGILTVCLGLTITGGSFLWPKPEKPENYKQFCSEKYQISQLEKIRKKLDNFLEDEEDAIYSQLERTVNIKQEKIKEIKKIPEFREFRREYKTLEAKRDVVRGGGSGLFALGVYGLLGCLNIAEEREKRKAMQGRIRSNYLENNLLKTNKRTLKKNQQV